MIGYIAGVIELVSLDFVIVQTESGVGYCVYLPHKMHTRVASGEFVKFFIETIVREDAITLYGFSSYEDLLWFKSLMKVSGVGAKVALAVIGHVSVQDLVRSIESEKSDILTAISGLGDKIAKRIISDLKKESGKIAKLLMVSSLKPSAIDSVRASDDAAGGVEKSDIYIDTISALENLGFNKAKISVVVSDVIGANPEMMIEKIISTCLKQLTKK